MRSALQAYRRVLDRDATRPLTEELKWLAGELAPARDTEVMAERFSRDGRGAARRARARAGLRHPRADVRPAAGEARERALAALDSDRYLALHDAIDALLAEPPLTDGPVGRRSASCPRTCGGRTGALRRRMDGGRRSSRTVSSGIWPCTRRARRPSGSGTPPRPPSPRWASRPSGCASSSSRCRSCSATTRTPWWPGRCCASSGHRCSQEGGNGFTFGLMHGIESARAERAEQRLPTSWKRMRRPKNTRWLRRYATASGSNDQR